MRCFIKQKENSVWILTVTVCPPEALKSNGTNTYVLAMGKSGDDHTPVIEHYLAEAKELMKGFKCYFGDTKTIERMAFSMLIWLADRPEWQMILNTMKEENYGKISGWSADVNEKVFPACLKCHRARVGRLTGTIVETKYSCGCDDWTLHEEGNGKNQTPIKDNYPLAVEGIDWFDELKGREPLRTSLGPKKLTADFMPKALRYTFNARVAGSMSKPSTDAYLTSCNVKGHRIAVLDNMVSRVQNHGADPNATLDEIVPKAWTLIDCFE